MEPTVSIEGALNVAVPTWHIIWVVKMCIELTIFSMLTDLKNQFLRFNLNVQRDKFVQGQNIFTMIPLFQMKIPLIVQECCLEHRICRP